MIRCGFLSAAERKEPKEVRGHLRRLIRRIRLHWPDTAITIRGDSHFCTPIRGQRSEAD
jgi:hypothetical protein